MRLSLISILLLFFVDYMKSQDLFYRNGIVEYKNDMTIESRNPRIAGFGGIDVVSSDFYSDAGANKNPALISKHGNYSGANIAWLDHYPNENPLDYYNLYSNVYHSLDSKNRLAASFNYFAIKKHQSNIRIAK